MFCNFSKPVSEQQDKRYFQNIFYVGLTIPEVYPWISDLVRYSRDGNRLNRIPVDSNRANEDRRGRNRQREQDKYDRDRKGHRQPSGQHGHYGPASAAPNNRPIECRYCGKTGHKQYECPAAKADGQSGQSDKKAKYNPAGPPSSKPHKAIRDGKTE